MTLESRLEAREKFSPKLMAISGVNGVETGNYGLVVNVEKRTPEMEKKVEEFFEGEAIDLPYTVREVGKVKVFPGFKARK